jgi:hypothetical protein
MKLVIIGPEQGRNNTVISREPVILSTPTEFSFLGVFPVPISNSIEEMRRKGGIKVRRAKLLVPGS